MGSIYERLFPSQKDDKIFPRLGINIEALEHITRMKFIEKVGKREEKVGLEGKTTAEGMYIFYYFNFYPSISNRDFTSYLSE